MSTEGRDLFTPDASVWPTRRARGRYLESPQLHAYLLDADDDLAQELDIRLRFAARQLMTVRVLDAEPGECELSSWLAAVGNGPGLLILDGLITVDTQVAERTATELLGAGDLLQPACRQVDRMVEQMESWRALRPTRFALLDSEFAERVRPWPQIAQALLRRAERRASDLSVIRAITCQPRLESRLVLFLWHLAARWGRVEPTGLRLSLPLTHRLLGHLVAAERPSVSHALGRLARAGIVTGSAGDLHLHGDLDAHLSCLIEPHAGVTQHRRGDTAPAEANRVTA
jgi:CRP/FNR family cyclic AMP-dependent transcriptional regulator